MRRPRPLVWLLLGATLVAAIVVPVYFFVLAAGKRVLLVGDSLMSQSAPFVNTYLGDQGFDAQVDAMPGSGLLDTQPNINWPARLQQQVADFDPDEVVVEFIGDYGIFGARPGVPDKSPQFYQQWAAAAQQAENILASRRAVVYWVIGPPVRNPSDNQKLAMLDTIYANLHVPRTTSGKPPTINEVTPFSDANGNYVPSGKTVNGNVADLRTLDGTHFTFAGALLFAQTIANGVKSGPKRVIL